jgi:C1A family cysteine protease
MLSDHKFCYTFQKKDDRDHIYYHPDPHMPSPPHLHKAFKLHKYSTLEKTLKTSYQIESLPTVLNQGSLGDCVANAAAYTLLVVGKSSTMLSRLMIYANCRCIDYTPLDQDDGTTIRTMCKALSSYGGCEESLWPYEISKYSMLPPLNAYQSSRKFSSFAYTFVNQDINSLKNALMNSSTPIIFGLMVYSSFLTQSVARTGNVPMPNLKKEALMGGHCACIIGFNDSTNTFTCANSWGTGWGKNGFFTIPYQYLLNSQLAGDFCLLNVAL